MDAPVKLSIKIPLFLLSFVLVGCGGSSPNTSVSQIFDISESDRWWGKDFTQADFDRLNTLEVDNLRRIQSIEFGYLQRFSNVSDDDSFGVVTNAGIIFYKNQQQHQFLQHNTQANLAVAYTGSKIEAVFADHLMSWSLDTGIVDIWPAPNDAIFLNAAWDHKSNHYYVVASDGQIYKHTNYRLKAWSKLPPDSDATALERMLVSKTGEFLVLAYSDGAMDVINSASKERIQRFELSDPETLAILAFEYWNDDSIVVNTTIINLVTGERSSIPCSNETLVWLAHVARGGDYGIFYADSVIVIDFSTCERVAGLWASSYPSIIGEIVSNNDAVYYAREYGFWGRQEFEATTEHFESTVVSHNVVFASEQNKLWLHFDNQSYVEEIDVHTGMRYPLLQGNRDSLGDEIDFIEGSDGAVGMHFNVENPQTNAQIQVETTSETEFKSGLLRLPSQQWFAVDPIKDALDIIYNAERDLFLALNKGALFEVELTAAAVLYKAVTPFGEIERLTAIDDEFYITHVNDQLQIRNWSHQVLSSLTATAEVEQIRRWDRCGMSANGKRFYAEYFSDPERKETRIDVYEIDAQAEIEYVGSLKDIQDPKVLLVPDGSFFAVSDASNFPIAVVKFIDVQTLEIVESLQPPGHFICDMKISPDEDLLVVNTGVLSMYGSWED